MAKREQEVKKVGLIAQAQAEYEQFMDEIRSYCQQARECESARFVLDIRSIGSKAECYCQT